MDYIGKINKIKSFLEQVNIDIEKGEIKWKESGTGRKMGELCGSIISSGYRSIYIDGRRIQYHHVIFYAKHGYLPKKGRTIDHKDRVKLNNRADNLEDVTLAQNSENSNISKANTSGFKGVHFLKKNNKWTAHIHRLGKTHHLGSYDTKEGAIEARLNAEMAFYSN